MLFALRVLLVRGWCLRCGCLYLVCLCGCLREVVVFSLVLVVFILLLFLSLDLKVGCLVLICFWWLSCAPVIVFDFRGWFD